MTSADEREIDSGSTCGSDVSIVNQSSGTGRHPRPVVAFGPEAPGWGSWEWVGVDTIHSLASAFSTRTFAAWGAVDCDLAVVIKHPPPMEWLLRLPGHTKVVYAPVDAYASAAEIDGDAVWLRTCARIVIHCERLRKYFASYSPVEFLDHHVKFAAPMRERFRSDGNLLWVGVRTNLPALVQWANENHLPMPLDVLTNVEDPDCIPEPIELGFRAGIEVRIHRWTPERQLAMTAVARAAIDIKGRDFRSRHKPPAKAIDFLASGVPLAMNRDASPVEHLARMGFDVADPVESDRWLSGEYWEDTRRFGSAIRELLSTERVARRWKRMIDEVLAESPGSKPIPAQAAALS